MFWRSRFADTNLGTVYGNLNSFPVWYVIDSPRVYIVALVLIVHYGIIVSA